ALLNDALKLTKEGDLEGAKQKAAQLKKELSEAETPEALLVQLEGSLLDQVTKVKGPERERLIALRNETLNRTKEADLPLAREKVAERREGLETNALLGQLEGRLVEQINKLKNPPRDQLIALRNEAINLARNGNLQLAKEKAVQLVALLTKGGDPQVAKEEVA